MATPLLDLISFNLFNPENVYFIPALTTAVAVLVISYVLFTRDGLYSGFDIVGMNPHSLTYKKAKDDFVIRGRDMLFEGLKKFGGRPFQVVNTGGPEIALPSKYVKTIGNDKRLSFEESLKHDFFPSYPGFEGLKTSQPEHGQGVIKQIVRQNLTQSLGIITPDLCDETDLALQATFGDKKDWTECSFFQLCPHFVARLSTRVFLGPVLAKNEEWLDISVKYTINVIQASRAMKRCPAILRPILYRFIPTMQTLKAQSDKARAIIEEEVKRRERKWEDDRKNGKKVSKTADSLGWMQEAVAGKPFDLAAAQLGLTFAAIHTTSDLLVKAMYWAVSEEGLVDTLRAEMLDVLRKEGWKKTSLYQMKFLDSFLKEVQRIDPVAVALMSRVAETSVTLDDGTVIPKGARLKCLLNSHYDPSIFPSPNTFDPYRFLKLRSQPGQENNWQFVSIGQESIGFGYGMHACPGRFFASNEVKIALCWLLLKYDWKVADGTAKPRSIHVGTEIVADPMAKLAYRRREDELDLANL